MEAELHEGHLGKVVMCVLVSFLILIAAGKKSCIFPALETEVFRAGIISLSTSQVNCQLHRTVRASISINITTAVRAIGDICVAFNHQHRVSCLKIFSQSNGDAFEPAGFVGIDGYRLGHRPFLYGYTTT